jgi:hypothetical protein
MWARGRRFFLEESSLGHQRLTDDHRSLTGRGLQSNRLQAGPPFFTILAIFSLFFLYYEDGPGILEEWVYNTPNF